MIEQSDPIVGIDVDQRVIGGDVVVDVDPGRNHAGGSLLQERGAEFVRHERLHAQFSREDGVDILLDAPPFLVVPDNPPLGIDHAKLVEGMPLPGDRQLRPQDVDMMGGKDAGHLGKQGGAVQREERDLVQSLALQDAGLQNDPLMRQPFPEPEVTEQLRDSGRLEIPGRHDPEKFIQQRAVGLPVEPLFDLLPNPGELGRDSLRRERPLQDHLPRPEIQIFQQRRLPVGHRLGADPLHVAEGEHQQHIEVLLTRH